MSLLIEDLGDSAGAIGLTRSHIRTAAELRLRSARLYAEKATGYLYVQVNVVGSAFAFNIEFKKRVHDLVTGVTTTSATWNSSVAGIHGGNPRYIIESVEEKVDRFLLEYLRVNEEECRQGD